MQVTVKELRKAYPNCLTAIGYVEMFLCIPPENEVDSGWNILVKEVNGKILNPREIINHIRLVLINEMAEPECELPKKVIESILEQIEIPKFYQYIKGKVGAM